MLISVDRTTISVQTTPPVCARSAVDSLRPNPRLRRRRMFFGFLAVELCAAFGTYRQELSPTELGPVIEICTSDLDYYLLDVRIQVDLLNHVQNDCISW